MQHPDEILSALEALVRARKRVVVLVKDASKSDVAADAFRAHLAASDLAADVAPPSKNPQFIRVGKTWVLFIGCEELEPSDPIGEPDLVLWPSEGVIYETVPYAQWRILRAASDSPWRPSDVAPFTKPSEGTMWDRLTGEDDIG